MIAVRKVKDDKKMLGAGVALVMLMDPVAPKWAVGLGCLIVQELFRETDPRKTCRRFLLKSRNRVVRGMLVSKQIQPHGANSQAV